MDFIAWKGNHLKYFPYQGGALWEMLNTFDRFVEAKEFTVHEGLCRKPSVARIGLLLKRMQAGMLWTGVPTEGFGFLTGL